MQWDSAAVREDARTWRSMTALPMAGLSPLAVPIVCYFLFAIRLRM